MVLSFDLKESAQLLTAVSHYMELCNDIKGLDPKQKEKLEELQERIVRHSKDKRYVDHNVWKYWRDIRIHYVGQMWGNTSGGWEGIGGCAMSSYYTCVIENSWIGAAFIYYNGKLAYIADMNDKWYELIKEKSYSKLPGLSTCSKVLDVFYLNKK